MISKIYNKYQNLLTEFQFKIFKLIIDKYNVKLYFEDQLGIITLRKSNHNFRWLFENNQSCDAVPMLNDIDKYIRPGKIAVDIGANIGITSIWLAKRFRKVYAFEPEVNNFNDALKNLEVNQIKNVDLIRKAVSENESEMELNILESYGHHSLGRVETSKIIGKQIVEVTTLDKFCSKEKISRIDFLKIDVEGFEIEVLLGAEEMLREKKIKIIAFELSKIPLESLGKKEDEILDLLEQHNYTIKHPDQSKFDRSILENYIHLDLIAEI